MFYEVKVRYTKQTGEDNPAKVTELYLVEGVNFGDAEKQVFDNLKVFVFGEEMEVVAMKVVKPFDLVKCGCAEKIFKCKVDMITIDGDKETRKRVLVFVGADDLESARKIFEEWFKSYDCELIAVEETKINEVWCVARPPKC